MFFWLFTGQKWYQHSDAEVQIVKNMEDKQAHMFVFSYIICNLYIFSLFFTFKWDRKYKTEPVCPNATFMLVNKSI